MSVQTVLLADESTTTRRVVELSFPEPDVQVIAVRDGEEAMACVAQERPDIVLADIGLPKRSGYDLAAYIAGRQELAHIPVVLLAGALDTIDETAVRAARCKSVIRKPFDPRQLSSRVRSLLAGSSDSDLDEYFAQLDDAFRDLNARRVVDEPAVVVAVPDAAFDEAPSAITVDTSSVPTLEALLGEIDREKEVFSLDALPTDDVPLAPVTELPADTATIETPLERHPMAFPAGPESTTGSAPNDAAASTDALVELVTDRVMKRLAEEIRLAADAVAAHLVADAAERVIREEVEKLQRD